MYNRYIQRDEGPYRPVPPEQPRRREPPPPPPGELHALERLLDRLHLRAEPSRESASLGKYYNGTPGFVLEHGEEWTRVRIGGTEGYMMTQFLLLGQEAALSDSRAWPRYPVNPATPVIWEDGTREMLFPEEVHRLPVIGMTADEAYYLVWDDEGTGRMGRIPADALWEGNG